MRNPWKLPVMVALVSLVLWVGVTSAVNTRRVQLRMKCSKQLERVGAAYLIYAAEIPPGQNALHWLTERQFIDAADAYCPSQGPAAEYIIHEAIERNAAGPIITESGANHRDGANVFFRTGECKFVRREQFQALGIPE